ncbi:MAG: helix-turn-helix transcriptional regulator [Bergeyella sp.]
MNSIGFKIKRLREQKDVSQEQLAYELDISQSNLSRIENGTVEKVDFLLMQKVCDFFDVESDYFMESGTVINDIETNHGVVLNHNNGVFNSFPEELLKNVANNQQQITQLIETQNKLIERLLGK